jgi:hypothetical protein
MTGPADGEEDRRVRRREYQRRYRQANLERVRQWQREWRAANPEKVRAGQERGRDAIARYNAENREKILAQKRIAERNRLERVKKERQARERAVERARRWDEAHPGNVRERERRYRQAHREQIRARQREYYAAHKEEIKRRNAERYRTDDKYRETRRRYRDGHREQIRERERVYRSDPELYQRRLQYNREWRQRERRRLKAGLPRLQAHHTSKADQRANAAAADAFFTRTRGAQERRRILAEFDQLRDEKENARLIEHRRRAERAAIARERAGRIDAYLHRYGRRLREEVRLDSRARELRGAPPYPDLEAETRRRAAAALAEKSRRRGPLPSLEPGTVGRRRGDSSARRCHPVRGWGCERRPMSPSVGARSRSVIRRPLSGSGVGAGVFGPGVQARQPEQVPRATSGVGPDVVVLVAAVSVRDRRQHQLDIAAVEPRHVFGQIDRRTTQQRRGDADHPAFPAGESAGTLQQGADVDPDHPGPDGV